MYFATCCLQKWSQNSFRDLQYSSRTSVNTQYYFSIYSQHYRSLMRTSRVMFPRASACLWTASKTYAIWSRLLKMPTKQSNWYVKDLIAAATAVGSGYVDDVDVVKALLRLLRRPVHDDKHDPHRVNLLKTHIYLWTLFAYRVLALWPFVFMCRKATIQPTNQCLYLRNEQPDYVHIWRASSMKKCILKLQGLRHKPKLGEIVGTCASPF